MLNFENQHYFLIELWAQKKYFSALFKPGHHCLTVIFCKKNAYKGKLNLCVESQVIFIMDGYGVNIVILINFDVHIIVDADVKQTRACTRAHTHTHKYMSIAIFCSTQISARTKVPFKQLIWNMHTLKIGLKMFLVLVNQYFSYRSSCECSVTKKKRWLG